MAVIRLEVEVDSQVYPELYARLRAISRQPAREERLRQLAAAGLLWETVRLQAAPVPAPLPKPPKPRPVLPVLMDVVPEDEVSGPVPLDEPPLPPPLHTEVQPPAQRSSRVKRMLDRGLFKNG